jgi:hypothetical protein
VRRRFNNRCARWVDSPLPASRTQDANRPEE